MILYVICLIFQAYLCLISHSYLYNIDIVKWQYICIYFWDTIFALSKLIILCLGGLAPLFIFLQIKIM